jgi:hypothetical protein
VAREIDLGQMVDQAPATARRPPVATAPAPREAPATVAEPVATATSEPDRKPVRTTVDLRPEEYEAFLEWCAAVAKDAGRPRVHGQQVMRVLVRRLLTDQRLARQVAADIKKHAGQLNSTY